MVANLRQLYRSVDDVDFVVGVQLDEEMFPGTTVPRSALIVSLFSLFGMGNSDRFSVGFAMMRCLLVDKPWDCHPTNALEDLLWARKDVEGYPDFRFFDKFWMTELDLQAHGANLLWRLITENTEIKCVQQSPLFPADPVTNPIMCSLPEAKTDVKSLSLMVVEFILALAKLSPLGIFIVGIASIVLAAISRTKNWPGYPPVLTGWPILGQALAFQKDPRALLSKGFNQFRSSPSRSFGIKLASLTHYVLTQPADLLLWTLDNPYEVRFSLHSFMQAINMPIITKKENFDSDIHNQLIRFHLSDPSTVAAFSDVIREAVYSFINSNPLSSNSYAGNHHDGLNDYFSRCICLVISRCVIGPVGFDNVDLLSAFLKFNDDAINAMGLSSLLPKFLQSLAASKVNKDFKNIRSTLVPIITSRRNGKPSQEKGPVFLDFIMTVVDNDERVAGRCSFDAVEMDFADFESQISPQLLFGLDSQIYRLLSPQRSLILSISQACKKKSILRFLEPPLRTLTLSVDPPLNGASSAAQLSSRSVFRAPSLVPLVSAWTRPRYAQILACPFQKVKL